MKRCAFYMGVRIVALMVLYPRVRKVPGAFAVARWVISNAPGFAK